MEKQKNYPSQYEKVKQISEQLEQGILNLFDNDENFRQWLDTCSKFHNYSLNNTLLIAMQRPDATAVAGMTTWNKMGRKVTKGSKAIKILAPAPYKRKVEVDKVDPVTGSVVKNPDGSNAKETKEITQPAFKIVNCFDVSDTEGRPLPEVGVNELTGEVNDFDAFFEAIKRTSPVPIAFEQIDSGAKGYYHTVENRIAIQENMSQVQTVKTAIHEICHSIHHSKEAEKASDGPAKSRNQKEQEAESVAYIVSKFFKIDTDAYSISYVGAYAGTRELPELRASLELIRKTANELITKITENLQIIHKERGMTVDNPLQEATADSKQTAINQKSDTKEKSSVLADLKEKKKAAREEKTREKSEDTKAKTTRKKAKAKGKEEAL